METEIIITNLSNDEQELPYFEIALANGICKVIIPFYEYPNELRQFGRKLIDFPSTVNDIVVFEEGADSERAAYYLLLTVFCYNANGHVAIRVVAKSGDEATGYQAQFSLYCEAASVNKLGQMLKNWDPTVEPQLIWKAVR